MFLSCSWYNDDNRYLAEILSRLNVQAPLRQVNDDKELAFFLQPLEFVLDVLYKSVYTDWHIQPQFGRYRSGYELPKLAISLNDLEFFFPISHGAIKKHLNTKHRGVREEGQPHGFNNVLNTPYFEFLSFLRIIYLAQSDIDCFEFFLDTWCLGDWTKIERGYYNNNDEVARLQSFEINKWP
ncbi:MAG: hypothetical protein ACKPB3_07990, partial [Bacteroidota bacterium]